MDGFLQLQLLVGSSQLWLPLQQQPAAVDVGVRSAPVTLMLVVQHANNLDLAPQHMQSLVFMVLAVSPCMPQHTCQIVSCPSLGCA
jgi:hypothetical protein